ncbi:lipid-A-disaccharide synthase [Herbaspirillum sp. SJZ099]|uniref:lipid-A-disaccharide synthase n=1 Tax=Herbaspirillum sp. SJZ099 TaxID=2572916 RepID=UPI0011A0E5C9|nr:lipid-A-disaccharide synthase [Herbaspirillum sp. SJZ099]TWC65714.1 lipid-A-disaccharide synthase [Herbaspirillum sp. SJZ099]
MASSAELTRKQSIALVAGESSGDLLGSRLLAGLRERLPDVRLHGIGGEHMMAQGFTSDWPMDKLTVRGLFEVIPRYREIKGIQQALRERLLAERPDVFVGVDYPGFNLGLEEQLRKAGIPTIHFIGPQIWAWRGWRIKKIARAVSHMLVIFPFEESIYRNAGIPVTYVGHPLAEVIPMQPDMSAARARLGLKQDARVVAILPGSRMGELKQNGDGFLAAARLLRQREPSLQFVTPMAGERQMAFFLEQIRLGGYEDLDVKVVAGQSHSAMEAADAVLVASGTASLEVALYKKPMVISYKVMWASYQIMRHMGYQPWVGLPNILAREFLVPELLQHDATPQALADAMWRQLDDHAQQQRLARRFTDMHHALLRDTSRESANAVCEVIGVRAR